MNSTIETKERVVARGFSHYGNSQLWLLIFIQHVVMAFCPCYVPPVLVREVFHSPNDIVFVNSIQDSVLGDKRRGLTYT